MSGVLASVDQRTQLVGENRLELLLFYLHSRHLFALNVFKIKEVVKLPRLSKIPHSHPKVTGVANIRGESIPVIDLRQAISMAKKEYGEDCNLVITEYNRTTQGFLIGKVDQIINMTWSDIMPPPTAIGKNHYLTALTKVKRDGQEHLVEIKEDGSIWLNQAYFNYATGLKMVYDDKWEKLFGFGRRDEKNPLEQKHCKIGFIKIKF